MEGIQIYELKRMDLRGATVIDGFPRVGLVGSIVANYLINAPNLVQVGITVFEEGVITGVAGVLLNEGRKRDFDVITLLSEAHPDYPDARAAARAIEVIDKLLLHTELDARPLYEEAERIELQLKNIHHQTEVAKKPSEPARPSMYG